MTIRNPFGVMDVPDPEDAEVNAFAAAARLDGADDDAKAQGWSVDVVGERGGRADGSWSARWNGGVDPTVPGDARDKWKAGRAEIRNFGTRLYLLFEWDEGRRQGLIDVRREGERRLVGKYINLSNPAITQPWVGLIVDDARVDGIWPGGRLDFRRQG